MKGMQKISRGRSIRGVLAYALEVIDGEPRGRIIGGGMAGKDVDELSIEFNAARKLRPDIKKPVWHNSLRLPEGDKLDDATWVKIADRYMEKMGFDTVHQRVYIMHDDPKGQHIHIPAMRIGLDGTVYHGKNENLRSTRIIAELEKEFGLTITKAPDYDSDGKIVMPDRSALKKEEIEKAVRTGQEPVRQQLQRTIDLALKSNPTFTSFVERLESAGITVRPTIGKGLVTGLSFEADGIAFSGSKLGSRYKFNNLIKGGMSYEQNRDSETVERLRAEAEASRSHGRDANSDQEVVAGDPGNGDQIRGIARTGNGAGSRTARENINQLASVDDRPGVDRDRLADADRKDRIEDGQGNDSAGRSDSADTQAKTEAEAKNTAGAANPALAASHVSSYESGRAGGPGGGGDVADTDIITTGNRSIDELSRAFKNARKKAEQEAIEHAARRYSALPKQPQNMFLHALKSLASRIFSISTAREREEEARRLEAEALSRQKAAAEAARQAEINAAIERNTRTIERERELREDSVGNTRAKKERKSRYEFDEPSR